MMTRIERELLLAVAQAVRLGNPTVKDLVDKLRCEAEPKAQQTSSSGGGGKS